MLLERLHNLHAQLFKFDDLSHDPIRFHIHPLESLRVEVLRIEIDIPPHLLVLLYLRVQGLDLFFKLLDVACLAGFGCGLEFVDVVVQGLDLGLELLVLFD